MKTRPILALGCLLACVLCATSIRADDRRFSSTLNDVDSVQIGLPKLTSDEIAVLDALVRHDQLTLAADPSPSTPRAPLFSQRLSAEERRNTGLNGLSETGLNKLDALVEKFDHPAPLTASGPVVEQTTQSSLTSVMLRRDPEIHGSVTLMVGGGSHGYSEYGGALNLTYYDPAHHFAVDVGYAEIHSSGGYGYFGRSCRNSTLFPQLEH